MSAAPRLRLQLAPQVRGDCLPGGLNEARPCPHHWCRHHLDQERRPRHLDDVTDWQSCALDVADEGGVTLEEIAALWGISRERVRQIEEIALEKFTIRMRRAAG